MRIGRETESMVERAEWPVAPAVPAVTHDTVHVWAADLDQPGEIIGRLEATLSSDEKARAEQFHFLRHRNQFVTAHAVLRGVVGMCLEVAPRRVVFHYGPQGKPELGGAWCGSEVRFNLSHAHGMALIALTRGRAVGVDLEYVRPLQDCDALANGCFSPLERRAYHALAAEEKLGGFFNGWTRKEAFVKALGSGLSARLDQFDVTLKPGDPPRILRIVGDPAGPSRWTLQALSPNPAYVGALAVQGHGWRLKCWRWIPWS